MSFPKKENETNSVSDDQMKLAQLKIQFHGTRKEDHDTIESYVKKLKSTADSLAAIGNPVSDSDMVLQLLAGLPCEYLPLQNTISSRCPLPIFEDACKMVYMQQGILLQDHNEQNTNDPRGGGGEQSYAFFTRENISTAMCLLSSVCTIMGAIPIVAGAVGGSRIVFGVGCAVAGWTIWQATQHKEKNE